ncbi:MAG: DUF4252 domain-containing protein [Bacteroidota bacterium]
MKNFILFFCLVAFTSGLNAQSQSLKQFYKKHKRTENTFNLNAGGWLVRLGATFVRMGMEDETEKQLVKQLAKRVRRARILVMEDKNVVQPAEIRSLIQEVRKDGFEDLIEVREDGDHVNIMIREEGETIKEMFILVREPDELVFLALKTKIKTKHLNRLVKLLLEKENISLNG